MNILFEQPEINDFYDRYYGLLMNESDRGCILLGVSILDEQLDNLFRKVLPKDTSKKKAKRIFDGNGAFGNIASKLDIAYVCRLLPLDVVESVKELRKARNMLAHQTSPFSLDDNLEVIFKVLKRLEGKGCALSCLTEMSGSIIREEFLNKMLGVEHPAPKEEGEKLFKTIDEVLEYIEDNENIVDILKEKRIRVLFVLCVLLLNALIVFHRNLSLKMFEANENA